ncbi:MAG: DUF1786 family protein [Candidatus Hodarchaeales archaeon]
MLLGIDVGQGTTDILLWDPNEPIENAIQLIIPSASRRLAHQISAFDGDIYCHGSVMGGSPLASVLKKKVRNGSKVYMTIEAAMSIRYHQKFVTDLGIEILKPEDPIPEGVRPFSTGDIDFKWLLDLFEQILGDKPIIDKVGLAMQDHGLHEVNKLARDTRMAFYRETLEKSRDLEDLGFKEKIPNRFPRLKAVLHEKEKWFSKKNHFIIDSSPIAIMGALLDEKVKEQMYGKAKTVINYGNGHTLVCALDSDNKVLGLFEHHTGRIKDPEKFDAYLTKFLKGKLEAKEVLKDQGHGSFYLGDIPREAFDNIVVIGPKRNIGKKSRFRMLFASPGGSMMIAGPLALITILHNE